MLATVLKTVNPTYLVDNIPRLVYYLLHVSDTAISYKKNHSFCVYLTRNNLEKMCYLDILS